MTCCSSCKETFGDLPVLVVWSVFIAHKNSYFSLRTGILDRQRKIRIPHEDAWSWNFDEEAKYRISCRSFGCCVWPIAEVTLLESWSRILLRVWLFCVPCPCLLFEFCGWGWVWPWSGLENRCTRVSSYGSCAVCPSRRAKHTRISMLWSPNVSRRLRCARSASTQRVASNSPTHASSFRHLVAFFFNSTLAYMAYWQPEERERMFVNSTDQGLPYHYID